MCKISTFDNLGVKFYIDPIFPFYKHSSLSLLPADYNVQEKKTEFHSRALLAS